MLRGGLYLRKTLLQQQTGIQECCELNCFTLGMPLDIWINSNLCFVGFLCLCVLQYLFAGEHLDLTAMMNTWTLQKGIPLVTITRKGPYLLLRQDRFLKTVMPSDPLWSTFQQG